MKTPALLALLSLLSTSIPGLTGRAQAGEVAPPRLTLALSNAPSNPPGMIEIPNAPGSAHPAGMIEIPNGASFERSRLPPPMTKRRSLNITGTVVTIIGGVGAIVGGAFLIGGAVSDSHGGCRADFSCDLGAGIDMAFGEIILGVAVPHLVAGGILFFAASHERN
jgi:hypothetical protein